MLNYIADISLIKWVRYLESSIVCKLKQMIAIVKIGNIDRTQFGSPFWLYNKGCRNKSFLEKESKRRYIWRHPCVPMDPSSRRLLSFPTIVLSLTRESRVMCHTHCASLHEVGHYAWRTGSLRPARL